MILLCAYELIDYKVMSMIRAPATGAVFGKVASRLEQLGTLLIRTVCIFSAPQGVNQSPYTLDTLSNWTHPPGLHGPSLYRLW